jgi:hypothetical protein
MLKVLVMLSKAFNPDGFSFVKIYDFNLLDEENQEEILKIAKENEIQLGIEVVDSSKEVILKLIECESEKIYNIVCYQCNSIISSNKDIYCIYDKNFCTTTCRNIFYSKNIK